LPDSRERGRINEYTRKPGRIGVFLVDDHEIFRRGIRALLAGEPGIDVAGNPAIRSGLTALSASLRPGRLRGNVASSLFLPARGWA
jgi:hypothetical protein